MQFYSALCESRPDFTSMSFCVKFEVWCAFFGLKHHTNNKICVDFQGIAYMDTVQNSKIGKFSCRYDSNTEDAKTNAYVRTG